jgi:hypothetical protein
MPNLGAVAAEACRFIPQSLTLTAVLGDIIPNFDCQSTIGDLQVHEYLGDR